jgi:hypothetical protein
MKTFVRFARRNAKGREDENSSRPFAFLADQLLFSAGAIRAGGKLFDRVSRNLGP